MRILSNSSKALGTMLSRQQAWGNAGHCVRRCVCAHLEIWYTNGITSVCPWYQEQPRNMQEEDSVPLCQAVYLGQVWMMGEGSQTLCQDNSVLWLVLTKWKTKLFLCLQYKNILTKDILLHRDWSEGDQTRQIFFGKFCNQTTGIRKISSNRFYN